MHGFKVITWFFQGVRMKPKKSLNVVEFQMFSKLIFLNAGIYGRISWIPVIKTLINYSVSPVFHIMNISDLAFRAFFHQVIQDLFLI